MGPLVLNSVHLCGKRAWVVGLGTAGDVVLLIERRWKCRVLDATIGDIPTEGRQCDVLRIRFLLCVWVACVQGKHSSV